uniref:MIF4G domain-containing protein n=1 Tax=viral metagenome TaxID=1070528 RepID=A0A6C0E766_9ZZZZ
MTEYITSEISNPTETMSPVDYYKYSIDDFYEIKTQIRDQLGDLSYFSVKTQSVFEKINKVHPFNQNKRRRNPQNDEWRKRKSTTLIKDDNLDQNDKIYQEIKGFCNKISTNNHETILEEIHKSLDNFNEERKDYVKQLLNDLLKKARMEPTYCEQYIKLILGLEDTKSVQEFIEDLLVKYGKAIDDILPLTTDEEDLTEALEFQTVKKRKEESYDDYCVSRKNKNYQKGFSQFVGELYNFKKISFQELFFFWKQLVDNLENLIKASLQSDTLNPTCQSLIEENILYLAPLIETTIENVIITQPQSEKIQNIFKVIHVLSENQKIINKNRYILADMVDLFNKNVKKIRNKNKKPNDISESSNTQTNTNVNTGNTNINNNNTSVNTDNNKWHINKGKLKHDKSGMRFN